MMSLRTVGGLFVRSLAASTAIGLSACAAGVSKPVVAPVRAADVGEVSANTGILKGYLEPAQLPDSAALLPSPPAAGSAAMAEDTSTFRALTALQSTPRGQLAIRDADLSYPALLGTFSCAVGVPITEADFPNLAMLLRRTSSDAGQATAKAKNKYQRVRPFIALNAHSCTPKDEEALAKNGSYPSGHSSIGWTWALVLTEISPGQADVILQRGRAFSQSRAICGVHWQSDVEAGRLVGAATVARLHANPVFEAQLRLARTEIATAHARGAMPLADCAAETAAIATSATYAP